MSVSSVEAAEARPSPPWGSTVAIPPTSEPRDGENSVSVAAVAQPQTQAPVKGKETDYSPRRPEPRTSLDPSEEAEEKRSYGVKIEGFQEPPALTDVVSSWRYEVPAGLPPSVSDSESSAISVKAGRRNPRRGFSARNTAEPAFLTSQHKPPAFLTSQHKQPARAPGRLPLTEKEFKSAIEGMQNPFAPLRAGLKFKIGVAPVQGLKNGTNWVEWARFRTSLCIPEAFVIDVLVGKPVKGEILNMEGQKLYLDTLETDSVTDPQHLSRDLRKLAKGDQGSPRPPSQLELPERIRINSRFLNRLVRSLEGSPYSSVPDTGHRAIYYRPFHGLLALEEKLRARLQTYPQASGPISHSNRSHASAASDEVAGRSHSEKVQLGLLCGFIDEVVRERLNYLADPATRLVYYSDLWYLFAPGEIVLNREGPDTQQAYRVLSIESSGATHVPCTRSRALRSDQFMITITLVYIDTDGYLVGPITEEIKPPPFEGEMDITTFSYYPVRFSRTPNLRQKFIDRGRLFVDMLEMKHMHYTGLTLDDKYEVDCQVVVDNESALSPQGGAYANLRPQPRDLTGRFPQPPPAMECREFCCLHENALDDRQAEHGLNAQYMDSLVPQSGSRSLSLAVMYQPCAEVRKSKETIQDEDLLIIFARVYGFLLHSRKWAALAISRLSSPYKAASEASQAHKVEGTIPLGESFDQLVLPPGHKELVKSLISQHFRDKKGDREFEQPDIVRGKGKGLILLLHGAPGVGKTTTAETVAEYFKKPLFHITCGDLGMWAKDVEESLERNFKLANRWGCILLLDEAEVFLAARTPKDHVRNSLVAVFLRVLEYYAGVLFVTTNRLGDFDEAFASRVHMSLYYPPLSLEATQQVLALNLNRARNRLLRQGRSLEINQFAVGGFLTSYWHANPRGRWNGRQIRNACQTALALAEYEARSVDGEGAEDEGKDAAVVGLDVRHFQKVADAYMGFMNYMRDIYGVDPDVRAAEMAIRAKPGSLDAAAAARQNPASFNAASAAPINTYSSPPSAAGGFFAPPGGQAQQQHQWNMGGGGGGSGTSHQPEPPQGANAGFMQMGAQGLSASTAFEGAVPANPYPQAQHIAGMFAQGFRPGAPLSPHPQAASASGATYQQYQWGASTSQNVMGAGMLGALQVPMPGASSPSAAMSAATPPGLGPDLASADGANRRRDAGPSQAPNSAGSGPSIPY